ncbi:hypothetical protein [Aquimonas voraii]|nr:hypothetical protein [Aquimonas voraii]
MNAGALFWGVWDVSVGSIEGAGMRTVKLLSQEHQFALTEGGGGGLFLEVLCGGFAMYELEMKLNDEEIERFRAVGVDFLASLANEIRRKSPELVARLKER